MGNYLLVAKDKSATEQDCLTAWELIVKENAEVNDSTLHTTYSDLKEEYAILLQQYQAIRARILLLYCTVDKEAIEFLRKQRYNIDTTSDEAYEKSLDQAISKSENIGGELQRKYNELVELMEGDSMDPSLSELLSPLRYHFGYHVPMEILLSEYNDMKKFLKENKSNGRRTGRDNNPEDDQSSFGSGG